MAVAVAVDVAVGVLLGAVVLVGVGVWLGTRVMDGMGVGDASGSTVGVLVNVGGGV